MSTFVSRNLIDFLHPYTMLPSSTVENYLKAIYQHQVALPLDQLVPMGQIASALGVAPGTATTMVKTLAESGLVLYEPYSGVRLAAAGERLAALVLRRHRLVELFLVEIMGMSWAEVHDEAEKLEHVVSDRLIERMDEMLGHPTADPHGDPIPSPEGTLRDDTVRVQELQTLLTCPLNTRVTVARISDQDAAFLRFIETHNLKPGQTVEVEARDAAADAVRIRGKDDRQLTIGTRAASKLLVQLVRVLLIVLAWNGSAWAQGAEPFAITDNSFLIEEAFNQAGAQTTQTPSTPERTTAISGYMDFHFNKQEFQDGRLDFHRFVLLITHSFSDRIRFVSELELEHALVEGLEEAGELELEQAYVDFLLSRRFNVRTGMMLMPIGIINERHEPPVYYGVERPFVDTVIIPTTWFEVGAGVHGEVGRGWRYRVFVASPLNAREFSAEEGLRGGRQKGADTNIGRPATTGRLEYVAVRGLTLGASFWTGRSGFEFRPRFDVPVKLGEADVRYSRDRLELRGQFAQVAISNAGQLNDAMGRAVGVDPNVASALRGFYGEAGYRVISGASYGDVGLFARYENFDAQFRMPADYLPLREFDRDALVFGLTYWPDPDIALKFDYSAMRSRNSTIIAPNSFNVGLGWWF